jgi:hypothetical protein
MSVLSGTILQVKSHPTEEVSILLKGRPVVLTLRNVNFLTPELLQTQPVNLETKACQIRTIRDLCEGMSLVLYDIGVWNVNTTAFHHTSVYLEKCVGNLQYNSPLLAGSPRDVSDHDAPAIMGSAVLPKRRKYSAMLSK